MMFSPQQRALLYVRNAQRTTNAEIAKVIKEHNLDGPFIVQYWGWLSQVLQGNLGWSMTAAAPVTTAIAKFWPLTFEIVLFAAPLIIFIGIYIGVESAIHKDTIIDHASRVLSVIGWSLPSFLLGMMLLAVFFGILHWVQPGFLSPENRVLILSPAFHQYTGVTCLTVC